MCDLPMYLSFHIFEEAFLINANVFVYHFVTYMHTSTCIRLHAERSGVLDYSESKHRHDNCPSS